MPEPNYNADWVDGVKIIQTANDRVELTARKNSYSAPNDGAVEYVSYAITRPKKGCGPLAVFADIEGAIDYLVGDFEFTTTDIEKLVLEQCLFEFWRCRYTPSAERIMYYIGHERYCPRREMRLDDVGSLSARLADAVMLTEQIHVAWDKDRNTFVPIEAPTV